ncbi:hypothetical protein COV24_00830 [candidate division WWE3 bacterium CG10_big_fil_rev_8_21_14_0_10_32_10]|uniref:O-antigen ligase-related domain-containing protein n=1 Tax=candidate division WWE3 bacterium CG10_big_fil_rev_8_21_14_0_10_32_10 TaxID=1975090 RepID=A0A2H0RB74_UNCKA|nr:MAG: hypothetical protein COV24_00830 [candidate division WWE3 bacterium CG10_big_fil_rev_8_21_14_0_10_32_10]
MKKINLHIIQQAIFIFLIVLTPSLFTVGLDENFEFIKTYFLIFLFSLSILLYVFKSFYTKKNVKISFAGFFYLLFLCLYSFSTFFSTNFQTSFFGYFGRFSASLLFFITLVFYLISNRSLISKVSIDNIINYIILGSLLPLTYGFIQVLHFDFITWEILDNRVFSTFGQPNWYGSYLILILSICLFFYVEDKLNKYLPLFVLALLLLIQTQSISSLIALFITVSVYVVFRFRYVSKNRFLVIIFFTIVTLLLFGHNFYSRLEKQVLAYDEANTLITNDTGKIRLILLQSSLDQILHNKKIFTVGSGPETFAYSFIRPVELNNTSEWNVIFNKPHNFAAEEFFELGIGGFIFYSVMYVLFIYKLSFDRSSILGVSILTTSFFGWPTAYLYLILFLLFYKIYLLRKVFKFTFYVPIKLFFVSFIAVLSFLEVIYVISYVFYLSNPCLSLKILPEYQNYVYKCGEERGDIYYYNQAYLLNPNNKVISLLSGYRLLTYDPNRSEQIFRELLKKEPFNPIFIYHFGLSQEKLNRIHEALDYYKKANDMVPNYFEANKAVERMRGNLNTL